MTVSRVCREFWIKNSRFFFDFLQKNNFFFGTQGYQNRWALTETLKKVGTKLYKWCTANIQVRLNTIWPRQQEKNFIGEALVAFKKLFTIFSRLYLYFRDFFQVWRIAGQISRLFQEFKSLYEPCLSSFKISLKKYIIKNYKSSFIIKSWKFTCPSIKLFVICNNTFAVILVFINLHTDCSSS